MVKATLTPGRLFAVLSSEFKKERPGACSTCRMPFPYLVKRADESSANWFVGGFSECVHGCHRTIAEIVWRLWPHYDLEDLTSEPRELPDGNMKLHKNPVWDCFAEMRRQ